MAILDTFTAPGSDFFPVSIIVYSTNWTVISGYDTPVIDHSTAANPSLDAGAYWNVETFGPDCLVEFTISTPPDDFEAVSLGARWDAGAGNGYRAEFVKIFSNVVIQFYSVAGGVSTPIGGGSFISATLAPGDKVGFQLTGTTLEFLLNDVVKATETDGTYSLAGYILFTIQGTTARIDDFSLTAGGAPVVLPPYYPARARGPNTRTISYGSIVRKLWGDKWKEKDTIYKFSDGKEFKSTDMNQSGIYKKPGS